MLAHDSRKGEAMAKWKIVHDEFLGSSDTNLCVLVATSMSGRIKTLFEVNDEGLRIRYFQTARDAITRKFPIADVCYGYNTLLWENGGSDKWLDKVYAEQDTEVVISCEHAGTCEEEFVRAQVALGNE